MGAFLLSSTGLRVRYYIFRTWKKSVREFLVKTIQWFGDITGAESCYLTTLSVVI